MSKSHEFDWEAVLNSAAELQRLVPGAVLVGGTAAAIHAGHRFSTDADHVVGDLQGRFEELLDFLEGRGEWVTNRINPPVLILGSFLGVETGLRQLRRSQPLETEEVPVAGGVVRIPTAAELLRIKGWLIVSRNATRDYIDFAALSSRLTLAPARASLLAFDEYYKDVYRPEKHRDVSPLLQLGRQLSEPKPSDLDDTDVENYKGIVSPWDTWSNIQAQCIAMAGEIADVLAES